MIAINALTEKKYYYENEISALEEKVVDLYLQLKEAEAEIERYIQYVNELNKSIKKLGEKNECSG